MATEGREQRSLESRRFRATPETVAQRVGDEMLLIHMESDRIFVLNGTGARLWELLSASLDLAQIRQRIMQDFDVTEAQLADQLGSLVASLMDEKFIVANDER